jgi:hypothetical protein
MYKLAVIKMIVEITVPMVSMATNLKMQPWMMAVRYCPPPHPQQRPSSNISGNHGKEHKHSHLIVFFYKSCVSSRGNKGTITIVTLVMGETLLMAATFEQG